MVKMPKPSLILMKVDGTVTHRTFVGESMLPYAADHMKDYLVNHWGEPLTMDMVKYLRDEADCDDKAPAIKNQTSDDKRLLKEATAYVNYLFEENKTSLGRQMLYLLIWGDGYDKADLKSHVFPDVADAIYCWHKMNIPMCVYSGGLPIANRMLMTFSDEGGNIGKFIQKYLDVAVYGKKDDENSYQKIADEFKLSTKEILFLTDDLKEAGAARDARCKCLIVKRNGGPEITQDDLNSVGCGTVSSFLDIRFEM